MEVPTTMMPSRNFDGIEYIEYRMYQKHINELYSRINELQNTIDKSNCKNEMYEKRIKDNDDFSKDREIEKLENAFSSEKSNNRTLKNIIVKMCCDKYGE